LFESRTDAASESEKDRKLSKAVDAVRGRFGDGSIRIGSEP
jgi:hypothetical protein